MQSPSSEFIFLGTGTSQGVPVIGSRHPVCLSANPRDRRLRSSVMVISSGVHLLIDCGPDFRQQMLRENLSTVDSVLVTHEHNDHIIGLDDVRPINFRTGKDMPLYAQQRVLNEIQLRFPYAFGDFRYPGIPAFEMNVIDTQAFQVKGVEVLPLPVLHGRLPVLGFRIGNMAYLTDVSEIPDATFERLQNLDVLVLNALRQQPEHHSHLTLSQALVLAEKIKPKAAYFTHISHLMGFHDEVEKSLPGWAHLAYDGLRLKFS